MERDGTGHVWHAAASRGPTSYTTYYSTAANIAEYAPEFRAMIRALAATQAWFMATAPEEIATTIASYFPGMDQALLAACIARYRTLGIWTKDPHFPAEPWNRLEASMLSAGAIQRAPGYAHCVDDAIVTAALLAADDYARLWPFFEKMGAAGVEEGSSGWLTPAMRDRYRAHWMLGLEGGLNYYRASPLRPAAPAGEASAGEASALDAVQIPDGLATVRVPTTVLWGERDLALLPGLLDDLERWVPQMRLVRVPEASHWIVHELPTLVTEEILRALAR
jgi:pimeloyl-ACP methyl ester carboxylesterase